MSLSPVLVLFGLILSLVLLALEVWIGYLIVKTAVKNGVLAAAEDPRAAAAVARLTGHYAAGQQLPPSAPPQGYPQVPPQR